MHWGRDERRGGQQRHTAQTNEHLLSTLALSRLTRAYFRSACAQRQRGKRKGGGGTRDERQHARGKGAVSSALAVHLRAQRESGVSERRWLSSPLHGPPLANCPFLSSQTAQPQATTKGRGKDPRGGGARRIRSDSEGATQQGSHVHVDGITESKATTRLARRREPFSPSSSPLAPRLPQQQRQKCVFQIANGG
jgi:hypothetical protein